MGLFVWFLSVLVLIWGFRDTVFWFLFFLKFAIIGILSYKEHLGRDIESYD